MGALPSREANERPSAAVICNCGNQVVLHIPMTPHYFPSADCLAFQQLVHARNNQSALYAFNVRDLSAYLPGPAAAAFRAAQAEDWGPEVDELDPSVHYYDAGEDGTSHGSWQGHSAAGQAGAGETAAGPCHLRGSIEDPAELYDALVRAPTASGRLVDTNAEMCDVYAQEQRWRTAAADAAAASRAVPPPLFPFLSPLPEAVAVRLTAEEEDAARAAFLAENGSARDDAPAAAVAGSSPPVGRGMRRRRLYRFECDAALRDGRVHVVAEDGVLYHFAMNPHFRGSSADAVEDSGAMDLGDGDGTADAFVIEPCPHNELRRIEDVSNDGGSGSGSSSAGRCAVCGCLKPRHMAHRKLVTFPNADGADPQSRFLIPISAIRVVGVHGPLPASSRGTPWLRGTDASDGLDAQLEALATPPPVLRLCRFIDGVVGEKILNRATLVSIVTYRPLCVQAGLPDALVRPLWSSCAMSNIPYVQMVRETFFRARASVVEVDEHDYWLRDRLRSDDCDNNVLNFINTNLWVLRKAPSAEETMMNQSTGSVGQAPSAASREHDKRAHSSNGGLLGGDGAARADDASAHATSPHDPRSDAVSMEDEGVENCSGVASDSTLSEQVTSSDNSECSDDDYDGGDVDSGARNALARARKDNYSQFISSRLEPHAPFVLEALYDTVVAAARQQEEHAPPSLLALKSSPSMEDIFATCETNADCGNLRDIEGYFIAHEQQKWEAYRALPPEHRPRSFALYDCGMVESIRSRYLLFRIRADALSALLYYCAMASAPIFIGSYMLPTDATMLSYGGCVGLRAAEAAVNGASADTSRAAAPPPPTPPLTTMLPTTLPQRGVSGPALPYVHLASSNSALSCAASANALGSGGGGAPVASLAVYDRIGPCPGDLSVLAEYMVKGMIPTFSVSDPSARAAGPSAAHRLQKLFPESEGGGASAVLDVSAPLCAPSSTAGERSKRLNAFRDPAFVAAGRPPPDFTTAELHRQQQYERNVYGHVFSYAPGDFKDGDLTVYNCATLTWEHYEHVLLRRQLWKVRHRAWRRTVGAAAMLQAHSSASGSNRNELVEDDGTPGGGGRYSFGDNRSADGCDDCSLTLTSSLTVGTLDDEAAAEDVGMCGRLLYCSLDVLLLSWTKWIVDNRFYEDRNDPGWLRQASSPSGLVQLGRYCMWSFRLNNQRHFYGVIPKFVKDRLRRQRGALRRRQHREAEMLAVAATASATDLQEPSQDEQPQRRVDDSRRAEKDHRSSTRESDGSARRGSVDESAATKDGGDDDDDAAAAADGGCNASEGRLPSKGMPPPCSSSASLASGSVGSSGRSARAAKTRTKKKKKKSSADGALPAEADDAAPGTVPAPVSADSSSVTAHRRASKSVDASGDMLPSPSPLSTEQAGALLAMRYAPQSIGAPTMCSQPSVATAMAPPRATPWLDGARVPRSPHYVISSVGIGVGDGEAMSALSVPHGRGPGSGAPRSLSSSSPHPSALDRGRGSQYYQRDVGNTFIQDNKREENRYFPVERKTAAFATGRATTVANAASAAGPHGLTGPPSLTLASAPAAAAAAASAAEHAAVMTAPRREVAGISADGPVRTAASALGSRVNSGGNSSNAAVARASGWAPSPWLLSPPASMSSGSIARSLPAAAGGTHADGAGFVAGGAAAVMTAKRSGSQPHAGAGMLSGPPTSPFAQTAPALPVREIVSARGLSVTVVRGRPSGSRRHAPAAALSSPPHTPAVGAGAAHAQVLGRHCEVVARGGVEPAAISPMTALSCFPSSPPHVRPPLSPDYGSAVPPAGAGTLSYAPPPPPPPVAARAVQYSGSAPVSAFPSPPTLQAAELATPLARGAEATRGTGLRQKNAAALPRASPPVGGGGGGAASAYNSSSSSSSATTWQHNPYQTAGLTQLRAPAGSRRASSSVPESPIARRQTSGGESGGRGGGGNYPRVHRGALDSEAAAGPSAPSGAVAAPAEGRTAYRWNPYSSGSRRREQS